MAFANEDDAPIALDLLPDWRARFGAAAASLNLEVGPGHGGFALAWAAAHPGRLLVAIEQRKKFAALIAGKARERGLANLLALQGDARIMAPRLFPEGTLDLAAVHFPDPWWKRRHHRRRIVDDPMALLLLRLLKPGALLDFRTDVEAYAQGALETFEQVGFENTAGRGRFAEREASDIPSTREKRYLASGQQVWRLRLRRPR